MKTNDEYVEYFSEVVKAAKMEIANIDTYVKNAVFSGLQRFWGADNWKFKERYADLVLGTSAEDYDLPEDFEGMKVIREENTSSGLRLKYYTPEEFHDIIPKLSTHTAGYPQIYTIYSEKKGTKKIKFYPQPTAQTLNMIYYTVCPTGTSAIPDKFQSGVEAAIAVSIFAPGTRANVFNEFMVEVKRLQIVDKDDMSDYVKYHDNTDRVILESPKWYE